jgi:anti-anti-sigma factor
MEVAQQRYADVTVLRPIGRLDHGSSSTFQRHLLDAVGTSGPTKVLVDASGVDYVSSAGLRAFMIAFKQSRGAGGRLAIAGLTALVAEIFQISRFDKVLEIHPTVADAVGALSPEALAAFDAMATGA